jgi:hypothetical protein
MRKYVAIGLSLLLALVVVSAAGAKDSKAAGTDNTSTVDGRVTKSKVAELPVKTYEGTSLNVHTTTLRTGDSGDPTEPTLFPDPVKKFIIGFDDDIKFFTKGLPTCKASQDQIAADSAVKAANDCGEGSILGAGTAHLCSRNFSGDSCWADAVVPSDIVLTVFNAKPSGNGRPRIFLHGSTANEHSALVGSFKRIPNGDQGTRLVIPVPMSFLAYSVTDLDVTVEKAFQSKGKQREYVSARCHDGNGELDYVAKFKYQNLDDGLAAPADKASDSQDCTAR